MAEADAMLGIGINAEPARAGAAEIVDALKKVTSAAKQTESSVAQINVEAKQLALSAIKFKSFTFGRQAGTGQGQSAFGATGSATPAFLALQAKATESLSKAQLSAATTANLLKTSLMQLGVPVQLLSTGKGGLIGMGIGAALAVANFVALKTTGKGLAEQFKTAAKAVDELSGGFFTSGQRALALKEQIEALQRQTKVGEFDELKLPARFAGDNRTAQLDLTGLEEEAKRRVRLGEIDFLQGEKTLRQVQAILAAERERIALTKVRVQAAQEDADRVNEALAAGREIKRFREEAFANQRQLQAGAVAYSVVTKGIVDAVGVDLAGAYSKVGLLLKNNRIDNELLTIDIARQNKLIQEQVDLLSRRSQKDKFFAEIGKDTSGDAFLKSEVDRINAETKAKDDFLDRMEQQLQDVALAEERLNTDVGFTIADGFEAAVFQAKELGDAIKSLALDLSNVIFRNLVTIPLGNALSNGLGAATNTGAGGNPNFPGYAGGPQGSSQAPLTASGGGGAQSIRIYDGGFRLSSNQMRENRARGR